jgi:hypothetical protein
MNQGKGNDFVENFHADWPIRFYEIGEVKRSHKICGQLVVNCW